MSNIINITEESNRLSLDSLYTPIVCGNSNYILKFTFSESWQNSTAKTAVFIIEDKKIVVDFEGDECRVPVLPNAPYLTLTLMTSSGLDLHLATAPLRFCLEPSFLGNEVPEGEPYSGYMQKVIGALNELKNGNVVPKFSEVSKSQVSLTGDEEISGTKNFVGELQTNGQKVLNNSEISNPNLLINGDFRVNQRGKKTYTGQGYSVDRWKITNASTTLEVVSEGIILSASATGSNGYINQYIENGFEILKGKAVTFSICINGEVYKATGDVLTEIPSSTRPIAIISNTSNTTAVGLYLQGSGNMIVQVGVVAGNSVNVSWVKLEIGEHSTAFVPRVYAEELAHCQRFYEKIDVSVAANKYNIFKIAKSANRFYDESIQFKTTKRTLPTVHCYSISGSVDKLLDVSSSTDIAVTYTYITADSFRVVPGASGFTADGNVVGYFEADAEIY